MRNNPHHASSSSSSLPAPGNVSGSSSSATAIAMASSAAIMKKNRSRNEGSSNRKVAVRNVLVGFVLGVIVCGGGSLLQYTEHQMRTTSDEYERAVNAMMPYRQSKTNDCDCAENKTRAAVIEKSEKSAVQSALLGDNNEKIQDFDPNARVAIVTKIQGSSTFGPLNQSLCLLSYAYNHKVNYDVVVFSATQIPEDELNAARATIAPAKLIFVVDNPGLQVMVDDLSENRKRHLLNRCNVTDSANLTWRTRCLETTSVGSTSMPIAYNWQAEFRSLHIWKHPALANYRYMMWMDTDGFCTQVWKKDPIATMRRNDLVILFDHFPAGRANGVEWNPRIIEAFGKNICEISMRNGTLHAAEGWCKRSRFLRQIYGFFHITDLDFYRSDPVMNWQRIMIGDTKFSRFYDDQVAVTIPAAILAGNRSWHMQYFGLDLGVAHNYRMDGRGDEKLGTFKGYWNRHGQERFPEAYDMCEIVSSG